MEPTMPGLQEPDLQILELCCEMEMQEGARKAALRGEDVIREAEQHTDLDQEQATKSMEILKQDGYIETIETTSSVPHTLTVTDRGFDAYARTFLPGYDSLIRSVGTEIEYQGARSSDTIAQSLDTLHVFVQHILALFESKEWLEIRKETSPVMSISNHEGSLGRGRWEPCRGAPV
jgi:hypothetical protein